MNNKHLLSILLSIAFLFPAGNIFAQGTTAYTTPSETAKAQQWADSVLNTLTVKEKFGQMIMLRVYSNKTENDYAAVDKLIEECHAGGVLFFQGTAVKQAELTARWQAKSKLPLFVTIDGETGLGMRLSDVEKFPTAITMGAVTNDKVIYDAGAEIGKQCRSLGIQMNYAPVADVNINAKNPVIGTRSFGEEPENVARKVAAYAQGMQSQKVIAVAKHFPGHGDTETDSHHTLPIINHTRERLEQTELYPFKYAIREGIDGIMLGHLNIPALDDEQKPSSLSANVGTKLLQTEMGFTGLIMTDGLDMSGVTSYAKPGAVEVQAFLAGNDILLIPLKPLVAMDSLMKAYDNKVITKEELDARCRKVLFYKALYGVSNTETIAPEAIDYVLNPDKGPVERVYDAAATLLVNKQNAVPLNLRNIHKIAVVTYGQDKGAFEESLKNYGPFRFISYEDLIATKDSLTGVDVIVAAVFAGGRKEGSYGIAQNHINHIKTIAQKKKVVVALFANPYSVRLFEHPSIAGIVLGYENHPLSTGSIPKILAGTLPAKGMMPVTSGQFRSGAGTLMEDKSTLRMATQGEVKVNEQQLKKIDSLAQLGVIKGAYPGCQVLLAKDGKVFYNKSFGTFTYDSLEKVSNEHIFDVASLTKILATTPAIMKLEEQGKVDIDQTLGHYLKYLKGTDKEGLIIRDVLAHQAGLPAWIPFYTKVDNTQDIYSQTRTDDYPIQVSENKFMRANYIDTVYNMIGSCGLKSAQYRYSDLGILLLANIVELQSGMPLDEYLEKEVYQKMNLATIGYLPLNRFPKDKILPTEDDKIWRNELVQGYVHDMAAAMLGGVAGNAGLFANAWDVAAMMQMYLQYGFYNGQNVLKQQLVQEYTKQQFPLNDNRRGLGFDKPHSEKKKSPVCSSASKSSFGHSGFTGCFAWADPANGLIYVFLSNRIHPSADNTKLTQMELRSLIHQAAYEAIKVRD